MKETVLNLAIYARMAEILSGKGDNDLQVNNVKEEEDADNIIKEWYNREIENARGVSAPY